MCAVIPFGREGLPILSGRPWQRQCGLFIPSGRYPDGVALLRHNLSGGTLGPCCQPLHQRRRCGNSAFLADGCAVL